VPILRSLVAAFLLSFITNVNPPVGAAHSVFLQLAGRFPEGQYRLRKAQPGLALGFSYRPQRWPLGVDGYLAGSYDDREASVIPPGFDYTSGRLRVVTYEAGLGIRKEWDRRGVRPYLNAGWAYSRVQTQERTDYWRGPSERYDGFGPWAGAGVTWPLGVHIELGVVGRFSAIDAKHDYWGGEISGGGAHVGVSLGWTPNGD
jgi:hypothetical protein